MMLNLIFGIVSLVGVVLTIYFGCKAAQLERERKSMSWPQLQLIADSVCFDMKKEGFVPDVILAPGTRGAILAETIVGKFNRNVPALVGISFMEFTPKAMPSIKDYFVVNVAKGWNIYVPEAIVEFKDRKILVVDDFCLTGEFFDKVKVLLLQQGFRRENIKVFCAVITQVTKSAGRAPEYYYRVTDDDSFYFPLPLT